MSAAEASNVARFPVDVEARIQRGIVRLRSLRRAAEREIETLIALLDDLDGDADLEPVCEDEGAQCDDEGAAEWGCGT